MGPTGDFPARQWRGSSSVGWNERVDFPGFGLELGAPSNSIHREGISRGFSGLKQITSLGKKDEGLEQSAVVSRAISVSGSGLNAVRLRTTGK